MTNDELIASGDTTKTFIGGQKLFGRYKLTRLLGRGGMGVVWLARDEELDREVALKFLPAMFVNDRASLDDLKRETKRSLELTHPHIVRTYDFMQDGEAAGISMEYVDADTLRNRRIDQPSGIFEPGVMGEWVTQLCDALDYAHHRAAIVHRDLKPANLMVNRKNYLKVADFGISRSLAESSTQVSGMRGVSGTLVYMSPQQLSGEDATALDDVYGVGATLYELCTTRPPFYAGDVAGQVYSKLAPTMTERRLALGISGGEIPRNWETTIAACLAKDPAQRPQSAGEIAARLGLIDAATLSMPRPLSPPSSSPPSIVRPADTAPSPPSPPSVAVPLTAPHPAPGGKFPRPVLLSVLAAAFVAAVALVWHFGSQRSATAETKAFRTSAASSAAADAKPAAPEKAAPPPVEEKQRQEAERLANARGSILVKTDPPGAIVQVGDGSPNPEKTPIVLQGVKVGRQSMTMSLDGYETVAVPVEVTENQTTSAELVKLVRSTGKLRVVSVPPNLVFELKSKSDPAFSKHGPTGSTLTDLPTGDYDVTVTREFWNPQTQTAKVTRDGDPEAYFAYAGGNVHIVSDPPGATIAQVGTDTAQSEAGPAPTEAGPAPTAKKSTPAGKKSGAAVKEPVGTEIGIAPLWQEVSPGPVKYVLTLKGYDKAEVTGDVQAGAELPLTVKLTKTVAKASHPRRQRSRGDDDGDDRGRGESGSEKAFKWLNFFRGG